jgi:Arc/MetJ-type ribon-helix-helix transcriptional regulator
MVYRWFWDGDSMETEKITVNLGAVDLGQIDLLVEQGFYSNRTDFIRTAIRNQISVHSHEIKRITTETLFAAMGVVMLNKKELESMKSEGKKLEIKLVGMLIIANDVSVELAKETIQSAKVYGIIKAAADVKKAILDH